MSTLLKQLSHSVADSVCRSCISNALCKYVSAWLRTYRRESQQRRAMPGIIVYNNQIDNNKDD